MFCTLFIHTAVQHSGKMNKNKRRINGWVPCRMFYIVNPSIKSIPGTTTTTAVSMIKHFCKIHRIYNEQHLIQQQYSTVPYSPSCTDPKILASPWSHSYVQASPWLCPLNALMQDSCHSLVFKDTCYPWFSNTHAFSEASSQFFPWISLNSFTHQHPP